MCKEGKINNYDDVFDYFLNDIHIEASSNDKMCFFRGQSNFCGQYHLTPTIFREKNISEHDLFEEIIRKHSSEFLGMKPIEILCKMQHLGVPTRMLDLTKNPLVGLFFAVSDFNKDVKKIRDYKCDPEVIQFSVCRKNVKGINSDTVKIISVLPILKDEERRELLIDVINDLMAYIFAKKVYKQFSDKFKDKNNNEINIDKYDYNDDPILCLKMMILTQLQFPYIFNEQEIKKDYGKKYSATKELKTLNPDKKNIKFNVYSFMNNPTKISVDIIKDEKNIGTKEFSVIKSNANSNRLVGFEPFSQLGNSCNDIYSECFMCINEDGTYFSPVMEQLFFQIQNYYPEFRRCAKTIHLLNGAIVLPIVNTDRMRAQQGLFALFGLSKYWNILKLINYLKEKEYKDEAIVKILIEAIELPKDIWDDSYFEDKIFNSQRKKIKKELIENIIKKLSIVGINKEMLGCAMDTTYYSFRETITSPTQPQSHHP